MKRSIQFTCLLAVLFLASRAFAQVPDAARMNDDLQTIYATAPAKLVLDHDGPIAHRVMALIERQAGSLTPQLHPWKQDKNALLLYKGSSGEVDIRSNAHMAFGLAVLARVNDDAASRDQAIAILRFLLPTHGAGGMKCANGRQWHNQWQSAMWAYSAGRAAWLLWDRLDPKSQWLAARMISDEADRFIDKTPPTQVLLDTKAEENAWDSTVIALACNMFPHHPHRAIWQQTALRWQISSFTTAADVKSDRLIDGKPLNAWLTGPNMHDDYTLENHSRVHPDYMGTIRINLHQKLVYDWAGNPEPQSLTFNTQKVYANLKKLALPDGNFVYPNGQDWQMHRNADWLDLNTLMADEQNDAQAARLMRISLTTAEKMSARSKDGSIMLADEVLVPTSHSIFVELYADTYLHLRAMGEGPAPEDESKLWHDLVGTTVFDSGKFAILRTDHSISTFSWGAQVMGLCVPLRQDMLLTPNTRSMIGRVTLANKKQDVPIVKDIHVTQPAGGLAVCGLLERARGAIDQPFAFVALPDGRTIYIDAARVIDKSKFASIDLGTLGILNDVNWVYHDGVRTLHYPDGSKTFRAANARTEKPFAFSSAWMNIDGLGIVNLSPGAQSLYTPEPSHIRARLEQMLSLNHPRSMDSVPPSVVVFYPAQDWEKTRDLAGRCKLDHPSSSRFNLTLDDGKKLNIDLDHFTVEIQ